MTESRDLTYEGIGQRFLLVEWLAVRMAMWNRLVKLARLARSWR